MLGEFFLGALSLFYFSCNCAVIGRGDAALSLAAACVEETKRSQIRLQPGDVCGGIVQENRQAAVTLRQPD
jgi:hypothetical protein